MFRRRGGRRESTASCPNPFNGHDIQGTSTKQVYQRVRSITTFNRRRDLKGIMKFATADDSIHSTYGATEKESKDSTDGELSIKRNIEFKELHIREYARTLGDNPSCSSGPPVSISWEFDPETKIISVDEYEDTRPPRRTHFEMILPRDLRQSMLRKEWDITQLQIAAAVRANIKAKNQRRSTVNNIGKATKIEEMMEKAGKKVRRGFLLKKSTTKEMEELEQKMQEADIARKQEQLDSQMADEYSEEESEPHMDQPYSNVDALSFSSKNQEF
ncbi:predicted protein [Phaeodactylum tricornutum CCAP 1055/1]|jgi:hypothetical protein|uniref:Uncharacterized protein n=1 Tax=Phaeodactylum tricornutum (strain CCAP 1055/1) TaxID=556484 RepID=B7G097_PHATC|nr:predicted protein [Phaeodactylum tricornutum CCAP 1055/1]EEC48049.1 predicted protein [Phaeodactylum tricornutum CCAP 1055/1]|eukprot:XP_002180641.1 predicted protein [Phaeodactylum tricornutum CCAP 1055/1]